MAGQGLHPRTHLAGGLLAGASRPLASSSPTSVSLIALARRKAPEPAAADRIINWEMVRVKLRKSLDDAARLKELPLVASFFIEGTGGVEAVLSVARELAGERAELLLEEGGHTGRGGPSPEYLVCVYQHERGCTVEEGQSRRRGEPLTPRQRDVVDLMVNGLSPKEIAEELFISRFTVYGHLHAIYERFDVHDRAAAVSAAMRSGRHRLSA